MKKIIHSVVQNPLISGSAIIFLGSNLSNVFNFLFNLYMSKTLIPRDYGTLISLVSIITLVTFPAGAVTPTIVRFAGVYFANKDYDNLRGLFWKLTKAYSFIGLTLLFIFLLFTNQIGEFFHIQNIALIRFSAFMILIGYIGVANSAFLQARLDFLFMSISYFAGAILKLSFGILLVSMGYATAGGLAAFFISLLIPYFMTFYPLLFLFKKGIKTPKINISELFTYGMPAALALFGLTSLISTDILLVKHFFSPEAAGAYSVLSLLGRIVYFLTAPITTVLFPLIVQKHTRNENYHGDFKLSLLLVLLPSIMITVAFFLIPEFIIRISTRSDYVSVAPALGFFGVYISAYSLLAIVTNFYLSIKKTFIFIPLLIGAGLQALLIWFFHGSFYQIILISSIITTLLLVSLLLYYWQLYGKETKK